MQEKILFMVSSYRLHGSDLMKTATLCDFDIQKIWIGYETVFTASRDLIIGLKSNFI